jgi:hypothetical protein
MILETALLFLEDYAMNLIRQNAKGLIAMAVAAIASYLTPDVIAQFADQAGDVVSSGVVAALTAFLVWLVPNQK